MAIGERGINLGHGRRFRLLALIVIATFAVGACDKSGEADEEDHDVAAIPVETTRPSRGDIDATYSGTAPIEAFADAVVGLSTSLRVEAAGLVGARADSPHHRMQVVHGLNDLGIAAGHHGQRTHAREHEDEQDPRHHLPARVPSCKTEWH